MEEVADSLNRTDGFFAHDYGAALWAVSDMHGHVRSVCLCSCVGVCSQ